jgi:hypothetical protein
MTAYRRHFLPVTRARRRFLPTTQGRRGSLPTTLSQDSLIPATLTQRGGLAVLGGMRCCGRHLLTSTPARDGPRLADRLARRPRFRAADRPHPVRMPWIATSQRGTRFKIIR